MNMKDERQFVGYSKYRSRLVDGHVHTELCPHGSGDRTAMMIEKAIELRIERYALQNMHHCQQLLLQNMVVIKRPMTQRL